MKRIMAAAAVALPVLAGIVTAGPALADCPADTFCLYPNSGYGGTQYAGQPGTTCAQLSSGIYDNANSMRNYRNYRVRLYDFPGCAGATYTANAYSYDSDFGNNGFTDKGSSLQRI